MNSAGMRRGLPLPSSMQTSSQRPRMMVAPSLSRRSWKHRTWNSLDHPGPGAFIQTLTGHASRRGWLSLWLLDIYSKPVAMEYQLVD